MYDLNPVKPLIVRVGSLIIGLAVFIAAVGAVGPYIGLGSSENFLFYKWFGTARRDLLVIAMLLFASGSLVVLFGFTGTRPASYAGRHIATFASWLFDIKSMHRPWLVAGILSFPAIYLIAFQIQVMPDAVFVAPDSRTYLNFHIIRTMFYPLFVRTIMLFTSDVQFIATVQVFFGLFATVLLCEGVQRVLKNYLISFSLGIVLIFNWYLFLHGMFVLSDYPFYTMVCLQIASVCFMVEKPTRGRAIIVALVTALAIGVRPVGIFFFGPMLLLLFRPILRKMTLKWTLVPLVVLCIAQVFMNNAVFGYTGLSRFSGWAMLPNTLRYLEPDTQFKYPELVSDLYDRIKQHQGDLEAYEDPKEKHIFLVNTTNEIMGWGGSVISDYMKRYPEIVQKNETSNHVKFVNIINSLSEGNAQLAGFKAGTSPTHIWHDKMLSELAVASHKNNLMTFLDHTWLKFYQSWLDQFKLFSYPTNLQGNVEGHYTLDVDSEHFGFGEIASESTLMVSEGPLLNTKMFELVNVPVYLISRHIPFPLVAALSGIVAVLLAAYYILRLRELPKEVLLFAYAGLCALGYILAVNVAHVALARYLMIILPASMILLLAPLQIIALIGEKTRPAKDADKANLTN